MDKLYKVYDFFMFISVAMILLCINNYWSIIGLIMFVISNIAYRVIGYIRRNDIIKNIYTNINNDIRFRESYKNIEIIGIMTSAISLLDLEKDVNIFNRAQGYERLIIIFCILLIILGIYSFVESLINLSKVTDEGLVFTDGTFIKYSQISEITYDKAILYIGNNKKVMKIKYDENKYNKEIILIGDNFEKMKTYLEVKRDLNVNYKN